MDGRQKIRVIRDREVFKVSPRGERVLVEIPGEWAPAVFTLVRISDEYRDNGLIVTNLGPRSRAANAGLARGDVLLRYGGLEIDSADTLRRVIDRQMQGAAPSKTVTVEAVRGSADLAFDVEPGPLGITVSPSLHRLRRMRVSRMKRDKADSNEAGIVRTLTVIDTLERAQAHAPDQRALVEVPGELARKVLLLVKVLEAQGASAMKRKTQSLLAATRF